MTETKLKIKSFAFWKRPTHCISITHGLFLVTKTCFFPLPKKYSFGKTNIQRGMRRWSNSLNPKFCLAITWLESRNKNGGKRFEEKRGEPASLLITISGSSLPFKPEFTPINFSRIKTIIGKNKKFEQYSNPQAFNISFPPNINKNLCVRERLIQYCHQRASKGARSLNKMETEEFHKNRIFLKEFLPCPRYFFLLSFQITSLGATRVGRSAELVYKWRHTEAKSPFFDVVHTYALLCIHSTIGFAPVPLQRTFSETNKKREKTEVNFRSNEKLPFQHSKDFSCDWKKNQYDGSLIDDMCLILYLW